MKFGIQAHHFSGNFFEIKNYFWSRKYRGESAIWDGGRTRGTRANDYSWCRQNCISTGLWSLGRTNPTVIHAPGFWLDMLPEDIPLHGELWCDDNQDFVQSVCRRHEPDHMKWGLISFIPYNIKPGIHWGWNDKYNIPFKEKVPILENINSPIIRNITYGVVDSLETFDTIHKLSANWEGIMYNSPDTLYICDRSWGVLKDKPDTEVEVEVIDYEAGKTGKNIDKVGALICKLVWDEKILSIFGGKQQHIGKILCFCVCGLTDNERENVYNIYPKGKIINISFKGVSSYGIPQHANIYRRK